MHLPFPSINVPGNESAPAPSALSGQIISFVISFPFLLHTDWRDPSDVLLNDRGILMFWNVTSESVLKVNTSRNYQEILAVVDRSGPELNVQLLLQKDWYVSELILGEWFRTFAVNNTGSSYCSDFYHQRLPCFWKKLCWFRHLSIMYENTLRHSLGNTIY